MSKLEKRLIGQIGRASKQFVRGNLFGALGNVIPSHLMDLTVTRNAPALPASGDSWADL